LARQPVATQYNARPVMVSYGAANPAKLRRWTGAGLGEVQSMAAMAQRLFRTEQEGKLRSDPHVITVDDVTKGLGLEDTDAARIQQLLTETRVDVFTDPKLRSVRAPLAMTRLGEFLSKTERFTADQRMEVRRRAGAWWRKYGKPDYQQAPELRWNYAKALYFGKSEADVSKLRAGGKKRENLPQVPTAVMGGFLSALQARGIKVLKCLAPLKKLKPIQSEINEDKIAGMKQDGPPIIISADFSVLDGHHRMVAAQRRDPDGTIKAYQVALPIKELLREAHAFEGSKRNGIDDEPVRKALLAAAQDWVLLRKSGDRGEDN
jgi:hypothetical protein